MPSSVVANMNYDSVQKILRIVYTSGMVYDYFDVPEAVYKKMKAATSKGSFLNRYIKNKYVYQKRN